MKKFYPDLLRTIATILCFFLCTTAALAQITVNNPPNAQAGVPYSFTFTASGGTPDYIFFTSDGLPLGMELDGNGNLWGTPASTGNYTFTLNVVDSRDVNVALTVSFYVGAPHITNAGGIPSTLPNGTYLSPYPSITFGAAGGTPPYFFTAGTIDPPPPGMTLSGDGVLSGTPTKAGTYTFDVDISDATVGDGAPFWGGYDAFTVTIDPVPLTITAVDATRVYGAADPAYSFTYKGFLGSDNASSLSKQPTNTTSATSSSPVGTYTITPGGAVDKNYSITYASGNLTVTPASLTVTADDQTMPYGGPIPNLTVSYSSFVNGENASNLTTAPTATTTATISSPPGTYQIIPSGGSSPNYTLVGYAKGTLTITKPTLTITANPAGSTYGSPLVPTASLTVTYTGFVNGDDASKLTGTLTFSNTAHAGSPAGTYTLTPSGLTSANYDIKYVAGIYTINPAILTVTASNASMTYGSAVPSLPVSYNGFVNGDDPSKLTTPATATTTATSASPAGPYPITPGGASSPNYTFTYNSGTLTIGRALLNITANPKTKVYGNPDPILTYSVSGLTNGDNASIFTGNLTRTPGENVGTYAINQGNLSAGDNYMMTFTGRNLTITKAPQEIIWNQDLTLGCDGATQLQLNATVSSGLPVTYSSSDPGIVVVTGDQLTLVQPGSATITASQPGDDNHFPATEVTNTANYQSAFLVRQHWADVLVFDNTSDSYVQWQWYKNGTPVPGATQSYYSETPALNGQYYVDATDNTGNTIQSCPLTITAGGAVPGGIKVYPNPANAGTAITITCNYPATDLQGARIQIVDISGKVWQQITTVQPSMKVTMPTMDGIYIINLLLPNGQKTSVNVLVD